MFKRKKEVLEGDAMVNALKWMMSASDQGPPFTSRSKDQYLLHKA